MCVLRTVHSKAWILHGPIRSVINGAEKFFFRWHLALFQFVHPLFQIATTGEDAQD